ncbi:hypothetical protein ACO0K3_06615 [Undibacterium sp. Rencai35W]|uniref:hypothetical protein n=1 Tax=Undibacterium sp. Rencai35W TaxID=3413046 RepID=UPI003BF44606
MYITHKNSVTKSVLSRTSLSKIALSTLLALSISSNAAAYSEPQFQSAFQHFMAHSGQGDEEKAAEAFNTLLKQEPANPLLMAYAGAATSKLATTTIFPWKKMSYAEEGLAMLDKALQIAANSTALHDSTPVILEVKFVAANTFLAVPGFMNRSVRGSKLLSDVIDNPQLEKTHAGFRGAVWMRAAALALEQKRPDDAKRFLNNIIQNNAPQAEAARGMLKGVSQ